MTQILTPEDWLAKGYRRFDQTKPFREYAAYGLQKKVTDDKGVMYFITVYVYDNTDLPWYYGIGTYAFDVDLQFRCEPTTNVTFVASEMTIESVEEYVHSLWKFTGSVYYEEFNN